MQGQKLDQKKNASEAKRVRKRTIAIALVTSVIALVVLIPFFLGLRSCVPAPNTPFEYDFHMQIYEDESLLGMSKEEVYWMIGSPDSWRTSDSMIGFDHRGSYWDEDVHVWGYGSGNNEVALSTDIYFSDEGLVEQAYYLWSDKTSDESWPAIQGSENAYSWHVDE